MVGIDAAILFCDLRGSTQMAVELDEEAFVVALNRFFDCVVPTVTAAGGEVLEFIGDAVLAIFEMPAREGDCSHCSGALGAAEAILHALAKHNRSDPLPSGPLEATIALHEGRVAFGNVGSVERQDFTVIGPDVNLAARLGALASQLGEPLLVSERVAARSPAPLRKVGEFPLKGFAEMQSVFAPLVPVVPSNGQILWLIRLRFFGGQIQSTTATAHRPIFDF